MVFLWPELLWLLLLVPLLILAYLWLLRRRKKLVVDYANLSLVKAAMGRGQRWRRHVPPVLFLLALVSMLIATARPTAVITLPSQQQTIILAMDVSGSMRAQDVAPDRITASQNAAKAFVKSLPPNVRVGVVSFAGSAAVVQPPTRSHDDVVAAIDRFQLQRGTALGSGLILSLATLFPDEGIDISGITEGRGDDRYGRAIGSEASKPKVDRQPVAPGSYASAAIILLTDGQRTHGPDPVEAARMAADHGVRVYTVGFGTVEGEVTSFEGWSMRVRLDEDTLKAVAGLTQAEYFHAASADDLKQVYQKLHSRITVETKETEITALFAALAAVLATIAAALSVLWFGRVV